MTSYSSPNEWQSIEKAIKKRKRIVYAVMAVLTLLIIGLGHTTSSDQLQLLNPSDTGSTLYLKIAEDNITLVLQSALDSLAMLAFISLVLERSLEVFVHTIASPRKLMLQAEQKRLQQDDNASNSENRQQLERVNNDIQKYKINTKMTTLLGALTIGILLGLSGVRIFEPLFSLASLHAMPLFQQIMFRSLDIALTGLALAGGSNGIHLISKRIGSYVDPDTESPALSGPPSGQTAS